jgi:hypothetical protein
MATAARTIPLPSFNTAFAAYNAACALRALCRDDGEVERAEAAVAPLFEALVTFPQPDLSMIVSKLSAIVGEYGEGEVPSWLVEGILFDLIAMEARQ